MPLKKIKVLDLSQFAAGPFGTMILGDMGADVIKIEPLHGDAFRNVLGGAWSMIINRNKRSMAIDLKTESGKEIALKLASEVDIFLESYTPGTIEKLGLSYEAVKAVNPDIIYCSLSGYGQDGPYKNRAGYDVCSQAECGLMAATGEPDGGYVRIGASPIDYGTGMFALIGMLIALHVRDETGKGQFIDVSLFDTGINWMNFWFANYQLTGNNPRRLGTAHEFATPYQVFETKDKPLFIGISDDRAFIDFCREFGLHDLLQDSRFNNRDGRLKNREVIVQIVKDIVIQHNREDIIKRIDPYGIPYAPVNTISDLYNDPHVIARDLLKEIDSEKGRLKVPGFPIQFSETPGTIRSPAPYLGEHTEEILSEIGYDNEVIERYRTEKIIL